MVGVLKDLRRMTSESLEERSSEGSFDEAKKKIMQGSMARFLKHMVPYSGDKEFRNWLKDPLVMKIKRIKGQDRAAHFFAATTLKYMAYAAFGYTLSRL